MGGSPGATVTEEYNGTSWAAGGNLATGRYLLAGAGTQAAGLCMGGYNSLTVTEEYGAGPGSYDELFTASQGL
jgi:hypothetical protein